MDAVMTLATWPAAVSTYCDHLRARGLAASSIGWYRGRLLALAARYPDTGPWDVTPRHLVRWLDGLAPNSRRNYRKAVVGFYGWAVREGLTAEDPARNVPRVPEALPRPRPVREADYAAALALAGSGRDQLLVQVAGDLGLRRAEVACVHVNDLHDEVDGWWLTVHGKGAKLRSLPVPDELAAELLAAGATTGWVFPGRTSGHLSPDTVGHYLARVLPAGYSGHKLRHRFATQAYALEHDVCAVQELLGHAKAGTTAVYVQTTIGSMRSTLEALERAR